MLTKTRFGILMQATAQDLHTARLVGVPVNRTIAVAFALGAMLSGVAGLLVAPIFLAEPTMGGSLGLKGFVVSVIGGFGNLPGAVLALPGQTQHYYLLVAALALASLVAFRIRHSALGRAMIATKDSEIAAEQSGVDTVRTKLLAFMIGAVYAGLAGCLYASSIRFISPDSFSGTQAILLMTMLIVGGMGSIPGCIIGAVGLTVLPEALRFLGQWYLVLYGFGVIAVI
eukprot:gene4711-6429_t